MSGSNRGKKKPHQKGVTAIRGPLIILLLPWALAVLSYGAKDCLTLLFQFIDVSHDGSEERSLVGVIVHAAGHKVSQLLTRWCHWPAPAFVESLFL